MLYQLSYASPAQTGQIYRSGNEIASKFPNYQKNHCQHATYLSPISSCNALLYSGLRKFGIIQLHVLAYFADGHRVRRVPVGLAAGEWHLDSIDFAIILEVLAILRGAVGPVMLANSSNQQSGLGVEIHFRWLAAFWHRRFQNVGIAVAD